MKALPNRFPDAIVDAIRACQVLGIRAGRAPHRVIAIWAVVVERRVFVRSWSLKPRSWYRTFLEDPYGVIQIEGRELKIRAVRTRSDRLKDAVSRAYLEKYHTPGALKFARDLGRPKSRDTTTELVPARMHAHGKEVKSRRHGSFARQLHLPRRSLDSCSCCPPAPTPVWAGPPCGRS